MKESYKVLDNYFLLDKDSVITVKSKRLFDIIVTNWKYNFIIKKNELLDSSKYTLINT